MEKFTATQKLECFRIKLYVEGSKLFRIWNSWKQFSNSLKKNVYEK